MVLLVFGVPALRHRPRVSMTIERADRDSDELDNTNLSSVQWPYWPRFDRLHPGSCDSRQGRVALEHVDHLQLLADGLTVRLEADLLEDTEYGRVDALVEGAVTGLA